MNEEEKFDELLSSKLSEREFPFDELNWDEAERLIIKQERWRKIFPIALIFSAGVVAGITIMLLFIPRTYNALPNAVTSKVTIKPNTVSPNAGSLPANQAKETTPQSTQNVVTDRLPVQSAFVKKNTSTGIGGKTPVNNTSPAIIKMPKEHESLAIVAVKKSQHKPPSKSNLLASAKKMEGAGSINGKELNSIETEANVSSAQASNSITESGISSNSANKTDKNTTINTMGTDKNNLSNSVVTTSITTKNTTRSDKSTSANDSTPKIKKDSNNSNSPPVALPPLNPTKHPPGDYAINILSVYAGGNYSLGWSDNGDKEANGITPFGGFNFTHYFTSNISLLIGIGYSELNNLNRTYTSSDVQYDFGANLNVTAVTPQTVCYLTFPLNLQYNLDSKDRVSAGIEYMLLLTTSSSINTYKQSYFAEIPGSSQKENGYTQGFSNSDLQCILSYTRMLTLRLGMGIEFYHGLGYIENNSIPGIDQYARNNGFRLVLSYQLMK